MIDAANGMAGAMLPPVLERLPIEAVRCYFEPDGSFPNHEPNPLLPENREFIVAQDARGGRRPRRRVRRRRRPLLLRRRHAASSSPATSPPRCSPSRCSQKEPGAKIIYDVRASWAVPETIERAGGEPLINRVGHAFIKHRMRKEDAAFGGEVSGHYYFRDFSQADSGVVPFLLMLELISKRGQKLSEILRAVPVERYFITGELNTPVPDVALKLQELKERFAPEGTVSHLDGISVDADDWHFNVRPSNTEPLLRLNLEARSQELMERKRDEVLALIQVVRRAARQIASAIADVPGPTSSRLDELPARSSRGTLAAPGDASRSPDEPRSFSVAAPAADRAAVAGAAFERGLDGVEAASCSLQVADGSRTRRVLRRRRRSTARDEPRVAAARSRLRAARSSADERDAPRARSASRASRVAASVDADSNGRGRCIA